ncbi:MAG: hypothetical protein JZD41_04345 [Thermoproteus sp.]|nr:hypothetical protein [Thermoproteus sp.]
MRDMEADLYVVDEELIDAKKFSRVVERPSHKVPGIQLTDVVVGYLADRLCRRSDRGGGPAVSAFTDAAEARGARRLGPSRRRNVFIWPSSVRLCLAADGRG